MSPHEKNARDKPVVLIVDDDPAHLRIYGWIVETAGYRSILAEAGARGFELPEDDPDVVLLDYHLPVENMAVSIAVSLRSRRPERPILLLSDAWSLPADIAPFVHGFVRKGEPAKLVETLPGLLAVGTSGMADRVIAE